MKIPDLSQPVEQLKELIVQQFFQGVEPEWLSPLFNFLLIGCLLLLLLWVVLTLLSQIIKICKEQFVPLFYDRDRKMRRRNRQFFAEHIEQEIRQLNLREEWKYYRFTELEAEVEAEGRRRGGSLLPFWQPTYTDLRREKSLSKALENSKERLIFVEGEPGSGKSVALRYVAQQMANQARKSRNIKTTIPLYINLKKLERNPEQEINRELIESFVKRELNRVNDRDIEEFLETEFTRGIREGTWLFLFDSFDEIPEVLSSVEADNTIKSYADAIQDFLSGFNKCRGIIASRQFRGPKHLGWSRFRILPLENRRLELIRRVRLDPRIERELIGNLRMAHSEIQNMTKNPMFLSILCDYVRDGNPFPENGHSVFERYIEKRLNRDTERLKRRYDLEPQQIRKTAEIVAFCISKDAILGLNPTRQQIKEAMHRLGFRIIGNFDEHLNALEYLKIARTDTEVIPGDEQSFTFAHRRFQEYFATCVVLRNLENVSIRELITDGRWRETAVVICQTQSLSTLSPIFDEVRLILDEVKNSISGLIENPLDYINNNETYNSDAPPKSFIWTPGLLHLLGLLQEGFASRIQDFPDDIKTQIGQLLVSASVTGTRLDKKWSLEVAGITPQPILLWLLRNAFSIPSQWIQDVAYRQTSRLNKIPKDIAQSIRDSLLRLFAEGNLKRKDFTTYAHLSRLDKSEHFIKVMQLLQRVVWIDICLHITLFLILYYQKENTIIYYQKENTIISLLMMIFFSCILSYYFLKGLIDAWLFPKKGIEIGTFDFYRKFFPVLFRFFTLVLLLLSQLLSSNLFVVNFIFLLLMSWSIFALLSTKTGELCDLHWYPLIFSSPLFYIFNNYNKIIKSIIKNYYIVFICFMLVILFLLHSFYDFYILNLIVFMFTIFNPIFFISSIVFLFYRSIVFLFYQSYQWLTDWLKWAKWNGKKFYNISAAKLLSEIPLYYYDEYLRKSIILARQEVILNATEESETILEQLVLAIENFAYLQQKAESNKENKSKISLDHLSESQFITRWLKRYAKNNPSKITELSNCLDEIYLLLEQTRSRRKTNTTSN